MASVFEWNARQIGKRAVQAARIVRDQCEARDHETRAESTRQRRRRWLGGKRFFPRSQRSSVACKR